MSAGIVRRVDRLERHLRAYNTDLAARIRRFLLVGYRANTDPPTRAKVERITAIIRTLSARQQTAVGGHHDRGKP